MPRRELNEPKTGFNGHRIHRLALPRAKRTHSQAKMCIAPDIDWDELT